MTPTYDNASGEAGVGVDGLATKSTLLNSDLHYEPLGNLVQANVDGHRAAATLLNELRSHFTDPDALFLAIKSLLPDCRNAETLATLRGFARCCQKQIERGQT